MSKIINFYKWLKIEAARPPDTYNQSTLIYSLNRESILREVLSKFEKVFEGECDGGYTTKNT